MFTIRSSLIIYAATSVVGVVVGLLLGNFFKFPLFVTVPAAVIFAFIGEFAVGQGLFTRVELAGNAVVLISPFRRVKVVSAEVAAVDLWVRSADEDRKPFWSQAGVLRITLTNGQRMNVGMMEIALLRKIASRLSPSSSPRDLKPDFRRLQWNRHKLDTLIAVVGTVWFLHDANTVQIHRGALLSRSSTGA